jgi:hypothetical protein
MEGVPYLQTGYLKSYSLSYDLAPYLKKLVNSYQNTVSYQLNGYVLRSIYMWVWFCIRLAHFPKYKNKNIL